MSDLIKREDVQREIQVSFDEGAFRWQDGQDLMDRINAIPAAQRWVRVEDGLPKPIHPSDPNYMPYLICDSLGYMYVADYTYGKYSTAYSFHVDGEEVTDVIYWMPIEPPKEDAG